MPVGKAYRWAILLAQANESKALLALIQAGRDGLDGGADLRFSGRCTVMRQNASRMHCDLARNQVFLQGEIISA
jgi:hypothetical protein